MINLIDVEFFRSCVRRRRSNTQKKKKEVFKQKRGKKMIFKSILCVDKYVENKLLAWCMNEFSCLLTKTENYT